MAGRKYLHRLMERAAGERIAETQPALRPEAPAAREGGEEDPLDLTALHASPRPATEARRRTETVLAPIAPRAFVREPSTETGAGRGTAGPRVQPAPSPAGAERVAPHPVATPVAMRASERERLAPNVPLRIEPPARLEPQVAARSEGHPFSGPLPVAAAAPAATPRQLVPPSAAEPPAALRAEPLHVRESSVPRLEPPPLAAPPTPAPPRAPVALQPRAAAEHPPLPPPAPVLSIGRVLVEVLPAPPPPVAPAPVIVQRVAATTAPAPSTILRRGFGLGQS